MLCYFPEDGSGERTIFDDVSAGDMTNVTRRLEALESVSSLLHCFGINYKEETNFEGKFSIF